MKTIWNWETTDSRLLWLSVEHFTTREAWNKPFDIHPILVMILEKFRGSLPKGYWIKIHCGYKQKANQTNNYHYIGRAVDFHVVGCSFLEAESHLIKFLRTQKLINSGEEDQLINYVGLGNYPEWLDPGFHLDIRGTRASWSKIDGKYVAYEVGLTKAKELKL